MRAALPWLLWLLVLFVKCPATRLLQSSSDEEQNNPLVRPFQRTATEAATEFVAARWAQLEARLPLAARNLFRGSQPVQPVQAAELSAMVRPTVCWVPKMPKTQPVPLGLGRGFNAGGTGVNGAHAAFRAPFVRAFRALERAQRLGKYRYSTVRPMGRSIFPKRHELPKNLYPSWRRYFSSTSSESRAKFFGRHLRDILARKDMKESRLMQQGKKGGVCTREQRAAFSSRFGYNSFGATNSLSYQHGSSKLTSLYLVTSDAADHNGAFKGLNGGPQSFGSMCYRLLQMSSHYNVIFKRVDSVKAATEFVQSLKSDKVFGQGIKHVTISGHGNPTTLVLGSDSLLSQQVAMKSSETAKLLDALRPMLIEQGEARSTVFLESCSTGKQPKNMKLKPLAQNIAEALPGVEVHAFKDAMYPAQVKLQGGFFEDALFTCTVGSPNGCLKPTTFMSKALQAVSLLEKAANVRNVANATEDDEEFQFYHGVTFLADVEMCAEWCSMIEECNSFEFTEFEEQEDWIESPLGLCSLYEQKEMDPENSPEQEEDEEKEDVDLEEDRLRSFTIDEDDVPLITDLDGLELD